VAHQRAFTGKNLNTDSFGSRKKVAREAANLLYSGAEKEFKQAKLKAAKTFGLHSLPSNLKVALELDKIAEENEGPARQERLVRMRKEALRLMKILGTYDPLLVGSVWRGTIHHESDIDIIVHHNEPEDVVKMLEQNGLRPNQSEWVTVTKRGKMKASFHIHLESPIKETVEVIVHSPEEACLKEKCEIYGDEITGLRLQELEKVLEKDPARRFVPF
jgi:predicted nucleotidyltransferase